MRHLDTGIDQFDSSRLAYLSSDKINGIDLEFFFIQDGLKSYLVTHSRPIPSSRDDSHLSQAVVQTQGKTHTFLIHRLKGGQKLLLTQEMQELLLSLLSRDEPLTLKLEGYQEVIQPGQFKSYLAKMGSLSLIEKMKQRITIENLSF